MGYIYREVGNICFLAGSKVAIWRKPPSGDKFGPYKNPMAHVSRILFHSDFDYYGAVAWTMSRTISHPRVNGASYAVSEYEPASTRFFGRQQERTHLLLTHNLGYAPRYFVAYDGEMIPHGTPIQTQSGGRCRFVSAYATETQIRLKEIGISSDADLLDTSRTYQVIAFRDSVADLALPLLRLKPDDVVMGQGKFRTRWPHLRNVGSGDTPFAVALDRTAAYGNGGIRVRTPEGGTVDFGGFQGSLPAPDFINVGLGA
jgi:hypothetical protein